MTGKNQVGEVQVACAVTVVQQPPPSVVEAKGPGDPVAAGDMAPPPLEPRVKMSLINQQVHEGQTARLDCIIVGQPEPEVSSSSWLLLQK